jgi:hypothetical protein
MGDVPLVSSDKSKMGERLLSGECKIPCGSGVFRPGLFQALELLENSPD